MRRTTRKIGDAIIFFAPEFEVRTTEVTQEIIIFEELFRGGVAHTMFSLISKPMCPRCKSGVRGKQAPGGENKCSAAASL